MCWSTWTHSCVSRRSAGEYLSERVLQSGAAFCTKSWKNTMAFDPWTVYLFLFINCLLWNTNSLLHYCFNPDEECFFKSSHLPHIWVYFSVLSSSWTTFILGLNWSGRWAHEYLVHATRLDPAWCKIHWNIYSLCNCFAPKAHFYWPMLLRNIGIAKYRGNLRSLLSAKCVKIGLQSQDPFCWLDLWFPDPIFLTE